ncbi:MAG: hypothetical protein M3Y84_07395 [Acidobacteriota bacterium]|nr:hypothetical protein [Acidobacteriota bacterium]
MFILGFAGEYTTAAVRDWIWSRHSTRRGAGVNATGIPATESLYRAVVLTSYDPTLNIDTFKLDQRR